MGDLRRACELLQIDPCQILTAELIRKQYLKLALRLHPDRNHAADAAEAFRALGDAYALALAAVAQGEAAQLEVQQTQALFALFLRALQGEDVREELEKLGVYRPSAEFGVDLGVRFDPRVRDGDDYEEDRQPDVAAALKEAFRDDGLTDEVRPGAAGTSLCRCLPVSARYAFNSVCILPPLSLSECKYRLKNCRDCTGRSSAGLCLPTGGGNLSRHGGGGLTRSDALLFSSNCYLPSVLITL
jgi:hypothetical protein